MEETNLTPEHLTDRMLRELVLPKKAMTVRLAKPHIDHDLNVNEIGVVVKHKKKMIKPV
jgi:hypothetical protein